ncbi:MAG: indolepyruvate ferredoxin oxidoreductase, partial [Acidobacteria bacterium]|nr:indolepyruvate ferredoxin oxidoreductase [Acidobacteriota bacterium]
MNREILLGDEAVALGAVRAGLTAGYSYPGTPASEIMEYLIRLAEKDDGFSAAWCINEKVAYEEALGVSYMGKRCLGSMKRAKYRLSCSFCELCIPGSSAGTTSSPPWIAV